MGDPNFVPYIVGLINYPQNKVPPPLIFGNSPINPVNLSELSALPVVGDLVIRQKGEVERDVSLERLCETKRPTTGPSFHPSLV